MHSSPMQLSAIRRSRGEYKNWCTPYEALKMATDDNAELIQMCGPRDPCKGKPGMVKDWTFADLILVDAYLLETIDKIAGQDEEHCRHHERHQYLKEHQ